MGIDASAGIFQLSAMIFTRSVSLISFPAQGVAILCSTISAERQQYPTKPIQSN